MNALPLDPTFFIKRSNRRELIGLSGVYVDDLLRAGTPEFKQLCRGTHETFDMTDEQTLPQNFAGFHLSNDNGTPTLDQVEYASRLEELPTTCSL